MTLSSSLRHQRLRCAIYTRKSSEDGLEQDFNSLHAQREACEAFIKSQAHEGWLLDPRSYEDGGFSGGSMERPGLHQLLAEVRAGRIKVIVVYKVDRLTRSLADFARIIEQLDANHACFVSVTQQFNTTSSMGRLTLNVLLSFAQFEREVTGERIRDKIAASKRKGMWMGGFVPLGYQPQDRTLVPISNEAVTVQHLFQRYLELGSVDKLAAELKAQGIVSKRWITAQGRARGGQVFSRGALYHLLRNPLYIGKIRHRGTCHDGQHPAIIDQAVWDQVQQDLDAKVQRRAGIEITESTSPLRGKLYDSTGHRMTATYARKKDGRQYRYFASQALLQRKATSAEIEVSRVSAAPLEALLKGAITQHFQDRSSPSPLAWSAQIKKVILKSNEIRIELVDPSSDDEETTSTTQQHTLCLKVTLIKRRGETHIRPAPGSVHDSPLIPDATLVRALIKAHRWRAQLESGALPSVKAVAKLAHSNATYVGKLLPLAYLAPDLQQAILTGQQPPLLLLKRIHELDIPMNWDEQRRLWARFNV